MIQSLVTELQPIRLLQWIVLSVLSGIGMNPPNMRYGFTPCIRSYQTQAYERSVIAYAAQRRVRDVRSVATTLSLEWSLPLEVPIVSSGDEGFQEIVRSARLELTVHGVAAAQEIAALGDSGAVLVEATGSGTLLVMGTHSQGTFLGF